MEEERRICYVALHEQKSCFISQMQRPECCLVVLNPICHLDFKKKSQKTYLIVIPVKRQTIYPKSQPKEVLVSVLHQLKQVSSSDWKVGR